MKEIDFYERENLKTEVRSSKEKAIAFSFEQTEILYNGLLKRDPYNNKVLDEMLSIFLEKQIDELKDTKDNFLQIVDYTLSSLEKIASNPKKQLLKMSELQDINRVTSADFKTMVWLGSKPGRTLAEKIGVKGKVLAPKNIYSVDKKENRLVNHYFKKICEVVEKRKKYLQDEDGELNRDFNYISKKLYKIKRMMINNEIYYLKRPLDFEPNNTLIDHRDYSIVNRGFKQLNEYIESSKTSDKDVLDNAMELSFYTFTSKISKLSGVKVINTNLNPESIKSKANKKFEFYLETKDIHNIRCFLNKEKNIIAFQLNEVEITRGSKIKIKDKSESAQHFLFKFNLLDKNDNFLKIEVKGRGFGKKYRLDKAGLLDIPLDLFEYILSKISILEPRLEEERTIQNTGSRYINFNSQIPILNDELLSLNTFSEKYNSFFEIGEYYNLEDYRDLYDINTLVTSGDKVNLLTKYLKVLKEKQKIKESDVCIYSAAENLDVDIQKDILSVFKSNIKESYPIWRSILAIYAKDFEKNWIKENTQVVVIDLNVLIPSLNIVVKKRGEYEHHPALDYEMQGISLRDFLKKYVEQYLEQNLLKLSEAEIENLISSGKVYKAIFLREKYIILNKRNNFYLERDNKILKSLKDEFKNNLIKELNKFIRNDGKGYTHFILIADYLDSYIKVKGTEVKNTFESELSLEKDEMLKRLNRKTPIWNEFLPNLSLETLKKDSDNKESEKAKTHFYNLDLIKDKSINLTLGKEEIFDVDEKLELPAGIKSMKFPLHSENSFNKKVYFLEITNESNIKDIPIEFNLKIGYSYGSKDPYKVMLIPTDKSLDSKLFTTRWIEKMDDFKMKKIEFPELLIDLDIKGSIAIIDGVLEYINCQKNFLKSYLRRYKNRLRKFIAKEINCGNHSFVIDNLFNRPAIDELVKMLKSDLEKEDLKKEIKMFLSAFGSLITFKLELDQNDTLVYKKRSATFLYKFTNLRIQEIFKNELEYISFIAEIAWLDSDFMHKIIDNEKTLLERCIKVLRQRLERMNKEFDKEYNLLREENRIWQLANNFRDYLEFLLAILMIQDKIKLNKKDIYEILYNVKSIDRKIQLDRNKYPGIYEEFNKSVRVKFEIDSKGELDGMSDLAYSLYNYMTGDNGSDSIKIREVKEEDEEV